MKMTPRNLTRTQLLEAVSYALNYSRNTKLPGCPHGFKDTYEIAAYLDKHEVRHAQENKQEGDI